MQELFRSVILPEQGKFLSVKSKWDDSKSQYLAIGYNLISSVNKEQKKICYLSVFSRFGVSLFKQKLDLSEIVELDWSKDPDKQGSFSDLLAIILDNGKVLLWDSSNPSSTIPIETNWKGLTCGRFAYHLQVLAIGSAKGNLMLWNRKISRKIPILGKHSKGISNAAWSNFQGSLNYLGLCAEDGSFSINSTEGDTRFNGKVDGYPTDLKFFDRSDVSERKYRNVLSFVINMKSIYIHCIDCAESAVELSLNPKYGTIIAYEWLKGDKVIVSFSNGYLVILSTFQNVGQELFNVKDFKDRVVDMKVSTSLELYVASIGDGQLKLRDVEDISQVDSMVSLEHERNMVDSIAISNDSDIVTVICKSGHIYSFLKHLPIVYSETDSEGNFAWLSGLKDIQVSSVKQFDERFSTEVSTMEATEDMLVKISLDEEPYCFCLGFGYLCVALNSSIQLYSMHATEKISELAFSHPISGKVKRIFMCSKDFIVMHLNGKCVSLRQLDDGIEQKEFPEFSSFDQTVQELLFTLSPDLKKISIYNVRDFQLCKEYNISEIQEPTLFSANSSCGLVLISTKYGKLYLLNTIDGKIVPINIPQEVVEGRIKGIIWRKSSPKNNYRSVCYVYNDKRVVTIAFFPMSLKRSNVSIVSIEPFPSGCKIISVGEFGKVLMIGKSGLLYGIQLSSHVIPSNAPSEDQVRCLYDLGYFLQLLKSSKSNLPLSSISELILRSLNVLDVQTAEILYRLAGKTAELLIIKACKDEIKDKYLLAAYCSCLLRDFDLAQENFLMSSTPEEALYMRRDLQEWNVALKLAEKLAPNEVFDLNLSYGIQLESTQSLEDSLSAYHRALNHVTSEKNTDELYLGLARVSFKLGDIPNGMNYLQKIKARQQEAFKECAKIMESLKQYQEAGYFYDKCDNTEKSFEMNLKVKNFKKASLLLSKVTSPKLLLTYGKAMEADKNFEEAMKAYTQSQDMKSLVKLNLQLNNVEKAIEISKESKAKEVKLVIVEHFLGHKNYAAAIEFCIAADLKEEAFQYARQYGLVELYTEKVDSKTEGSNTVTKNFAMIEKAKFLEQSNNFLAAGQCYAKIEKYEELALVMFLKEQNQKETAISEAVELVAKHKNMALNEKLENHLMKMSDTDIKQDLLLQSLLKIQSHSCIDICLKYFEALQKEGNYKKSRNVLRDTYIGMVSSSFKSNQAAKSKMLQLSSKLVILHSYILVKNLVKEDDHFGAAMMLNRVAKNIQDFPIHGANILSSAFIECARASQSSMEVEILTDMKNLAIEFASKICLDSNYKNQVDSKLRRKAESYIRKPPSIEQKSEIESKEESNVYKAEKGEKSFECIDCGFLNPEDIYVCSKCFCIKICVLSGRIILKKEDSNKCKNCQLHYLNSKSNSLGCSMCSL